MCNETVKSGIVTHGNQATYHEAIDEELWLCLYSFVNFNIVVARRCC